jgi:hypothetical protein
MLANAAEVRLRAPVAAAVASTLRRLSDEDDEGIADIVILLPMNKQTMGAFRLFRHSTLGSAAHIKVLVANARYPASAAAPGGHALAI